VCGIRAWLRAGDTFDWWQRDMLAEGTAREQRQDGWRTGGCPRRRIPECREERGFGVVEVESRNAGKTGRTHLNLEAESCRIAECRGDGLPGRSATGREAPNPGMLGRPPWERVHIGGGRVESRYAGKTGPEPFL